MAFWTSWGFFYGHPPMSRLTYIAIARIVMRLHRSGRELSVLDHQGAWVGVSLPGHSPTGPWKSRRAMPDIIFLGVEVA